MTAAAGATIGVDREYETIYVLRPDVEKKRAEDVSSRMTDVIGKGGGKLTRVENWGRRLLAYPVQRHKRGVYVYLRYIGHGDVVSELERNLRMLDTVIKFQTVKLAELVSAATAEVNEDDLKFEHVDPPTEEEEDESLAQSLGLEAPPGVEAVDDASSGAADDAATPDGDGGAEGDGDAGAKGADDSESTGGSTEKEGA